MFNFNVTSAFHLTQLCIEPMQEAGMGNIINISSAAAKLKQKNFSAYAAVKASLEHLTRIDCVLDILLCKKTQAPQEQVVGFWINVLLVVGGFPFQGHAKRVSDGISDLFLDFENVF